MLAEAQRVRGAIEAGATRDDLQSLLPLGGARNALDCAFWELEAKRAGRPVLNLAGLDQPRALRSPLPLGADAPEALAKAALAIDPPAPVKGKLTGDLAEDILRGAARCAAPPRPSMWADDPPGFERRTRARQR